MGITFEETDAKDLEKFYIVELHMDILELDHKYILTLISNAFP